MLIDRRRALKGLGALVLTGAALVALADPFGVLASRGLGFVQPAGAQTLNAEELMAPGPIPDQVLGKADAPVTIVEYASMTCSHCAHFHTTTFPELKTKYIDTGKVKLILREFPLDPVATAGFMLARCAGEGKYYPMVSTLFETQKTWAFGNDPAAGLLAVAKQAGMTDAQFEACLKDNTLAENIQAVAQRGAEKFGVNSTPTFFINGTQYKGALGIDEMDKILTPLIK